MISHQKQIKNNKYLEDKENNKLKQITNIKEAICKPITYKEAKNLILEYEYLGTMSTGYIQAFGIFYNEILSGVVVFSNPPAKGVKESVLGKEFENQVCVLSRGACTYWAHPHSASKLISFGCNWMAKNTKYKAFIAYSDPDAGEIGTVYQACNWIYTGKTEAKSEYFINGKWKPGYTYRKLKKQNKLPDIVQIRKSTEKHRYILIKDKWLKKKLLYPSFPYPKRNNEIKKEDKSSFIFNSVNYNTQNIVYKITNKLNNKIYIGQTIQSIPERYPGLKLNNKRTCGSILYNAATKYGNENFELEVIYVSPFSKKSEILNDLNEKEQAYINFHQSNILGYNIQLGGGNRKKTEEEKKRISISHSKKSKPVYLISPSGEKTPIINLSEFAKSQNLNYRSIHNVISKKTYSYKGWRLWKENLGEYSKEESIQKNKAGSIKTYFLYQNENLIKVSNLSEYCKKENLNYSNMKALVQGRLKSYKGYSFCKKN